MDKNISTFWLEKMSNLELCLLQVSDDPNCFPYLSYNFNKAILLPVNVSKNSWISDSVDPDQTELNAA